MIYRYMLTFMCMYRFYENVDKIVCGDQHRSKFEDWIAPHDPHGSRRPCQLVISWKTKSARRVEDSHQKTRTRCFSALIDGDDTLPL